MHTAESDREYIPRFNVRMLHCVFPCPGTRGDSAMRGHLPAKEKVSCAVRGNPGKIRAGKGTESDPSMTSCGNTPADGTEMLSSPAERYSLLLTRAVIRALPAAVYRERKIHNPPERRAASSDLSIPSINRRMEIKKKQCQSY
jgi:hypothetical protein